MPRRLPPLTPRPLPQRVLARELSALDRWAAALGEPFPEGTVSDIHDDWKLPVSGALLDPRTTTPAIQSRAAQALLDGAKRLLAARPAHRIDVRVTVLITLPDMFPSRICVFYDPAYFSDFTVRKGRYQQWMPLSPKRSLVREWGLMLPGGFVEQGFRELMFDEAEDDPERLVQVHEGEIWMLADALGAGRRA